MNKLEKFQEKLTEMKAKKQNQRKDFWSAKPGSKPNRLRILPRWDLDLDNPEFYRETAYHRGLGTEGDKSVVCLLKEGFESCPVCSYVKELYKTKDKEDAVLAKKLKAQVRVLYNIVDLDHLESGVQVWLSGVNVQEELIAYCANPKYGDITDPESGRNVDLFLTDSKNTKSGYNEYSVQPDPDRSALIDSSWLEHLIDLDSLIKPSSVEEIQSLLGIVSTVPELFEEKKIVLERLLNKEKAPSCFEKAKFSTDDSDCIECSFGTACLDKKQKKIKSEPAKAEPAKSESAKSESAKSEPAGAKTAIQETLARLRAERNKKV